MKKLALISMVILLGSSGLLLAEAKVTWGGLFYTYGFFWNNADFNKDTKDGDMYYYVHGDIGATAELDGITVVGKVVDWGTFGRHPILYTGQEGVAGGSGLGGAHFMELYLTINKIFDSPVSLSIGKKHVCYGYEFFDGGEDGVMGVVANISTETFNGDIFAYRLEENGGLGYVGSYTSVVPPDMELLGFYGTLNLMDGKVGISPYVFVRRKMATDTTLGDKPMWFGVHSEGSPATGVDYVVEFTMMGGKNEIADISYGGMHYMAKVGYSTGPFSFGVAYAAFSGDDTATTDKYELYTAPLDGPYTYGFYKWWPGFGPAHTMFTPYSFACVADWDWWMTNENVLDVYVGYASGPISVRFDFFGYGFDKEADGIEKTGLLTRGQEVAAFVYYNYNDIVDLGFTAGMFMPNKDYFGDEATNALGGYFFVFKSF